MSLHAQIMNLPCTPDESAGINYVLPFKMGHKQARHAAAELAMAVEQQRDELLAALKELCTRIDIDGASPLDSSEYDDALELIAKVEAKP